MHKEINFEDAIEAVLISEGGYTKGSPNDYDADRALFPKDILAFVQQTQPKFWERFAQMNQDKAESILLDSLVKELQSKGMLSVLRSGFKCFGKTVRLAYFAPNTGMDPAALTRYHRNRFTITRQVKTTSGAIPDMILAVNGLPVVCLELKNPLSGQTVADAQEQYCDRDTKELLFAFKQRCLVYFGVDTEEVTMTTKLDGNDTFFLPFNRGHNYGKGNPPVEGDYRTAYLWRKVLIKDSLLDILARFLHLQVTEKTIATEKGLRHIRKEALIFPRYHQLEVVRKLADHARLHGSGRNYLIQHSAGSGKSNSIAWLAHRLSSLHEGYCQIWCMKKN